MKVVVTGGGTGGHILPALAVINALKKKQPDLSIVFIGSRFGIESQLIPKLGIKYYGISTGKFRRYHKSKVLNIIDPSTFFSNLKDLFKFVKGFREARNLITYEKPDVVFAKGGYVSLPVGIAAWTLKIPLVIHESDTIMGISNKIMARLAKKVCVTFPTKYYPSLKPTKIVQTGNPIREDVLIGRGEEFLRKIGFDKKRKTILILGGSQGSLFINEIILKILDELLLKYQIIWVVGERNAKAVNYKISKLPFEKSQYVKIYAFVTSEISEVYTASDLVVSRAGSNVLFELAALAKPAILIPIEDIAGGHQYENAKYFSRNGAAFLVSQKNLSSKKLLHSINYLFENPDELKKLSEKMRSLAQPGASDSVAEVISREGISKIESNRENKK